MIQYLNKVYDYPISHNLIFYNKRATHTWTAAILTARSHIFILKTIINKYCKKPVTWIAQKNCFLFKNNNWTKFVVNSSGIFKDQN